MKFKEILLSFGLVIYVSTTFGAEISQYKPVELTPKSTAGLIYQEETKIENQQGFSDVDVFEACATVTLSCGWSTYRCEPSVMALIAFAVMADDAICGGEMGE